MKREILPGGKIMLYAGDCTFTYERIGSGKLFITIAGHDRGQFGTSTIDEIVTAIQREGNVELFIDARETKGVSVAVSEAWTRFFSVNREKLQRVHTSSLVLRVLVV